MICGAVAMAARRNRAMLRRASAALPNSAIEGRTDIPGDLLQRRVLGPLAMILAMQSVIAMASYAIPVVIPAAAAELGIAPRIAGTLMSVVYFTAMTGGLAAGGLVARFGAQRIFLGLLTLTALGIALIAAGQPLAALAGVVLIGAATGPMNPTGSHVLSRASPPEWQPFVFSVKQCGTPAGGVLAGLILPPLILLYGWRWVILVIPAAAATAFAFALVFGVGPRVTPQRAARLRLRPALAGAFGALRLVSADRALRGNALAGMAMASAQIATATYLVVYLWREIGLSPAAAGAVFSVVHGAGIAARIMLGAVAGRRITSRRLLVLLAAVTAGALVATALSGTDWPPVAFYALALFIGAAGNGWVGLLYSEIARLAPEGRAAAATAGAQFYMYGGIVAGPLLAGAIITAADSYAAGFLALALAALAASLLLARLRPEGGTSEKQRAG